MADNNTANINAVLSQLLYEISEKDYNLKGVTTLEDIINSLTPSDKKNKLTNIINNNPDMKGLVLVDTSWSHGNTYKANDGSSMKAATFVSPRGDVYVAYRGTGEYNWTENAYAYGIEQSRMEKWALDYFNQTIEDNYLDKSRNNLYVTGHSQGGHNAQFVTLASPYGKYITKCISIDGLGFSKEVRDWLIAQYGEEYFLRQCEKLYAYNGEYDYANHQGEVQLVLPGHTTIIFTDLTGLELSEIIAGLHDIFYILNDTGLNPEGKEKEASKFISLLVVEINKLPQPQKYETMVTFFKFVENIIGSGKKYGVYKEISAEEFEEFKKVFVPILIEIIGNNPEMITPLLVELGFDKKTAESIGNLIKEFNKLPPEDQEKALNELAKCVKIENGKFNIDYANLASFLTNYLPELLKLIKDNPELLDAINKILSENFGITLNPALLEFASDFLSWLPDNILADAMPVLIKCIISGDWKSLFTSPEGIALLLAAIPLAIISAIKQGFLFIVDMVKQAVQEIINQVKNAINTGIDFIGNLAKGLLDFASGILDAGINIITGISDVVTKFGTDVLETLKKTLPPQFSHIFDKMEDILKFINSAVKEAAEMAKKILQSFKDALKGAVDAIVSGAKKVVNALGDFVSGVVGATADFVKNIGSTVCDVAGKVWSKATEIAWDTGKFIGEALVWTSRKLNEAWTKTKDVIWNTSKKIGDAIVSGAKKVGNAVKKTGEAIWNASKSFGNTLISGAKKVGNAVKKTAESAWNVGKYISEAILDAGKKAIDYLKTKPKTFDVGGKSILEPLLGFISNIKLKLSNKPVIPISQMPDILNIIGSGVRMALNLYELQQLQKSVADLINIWQNIFKVSQDSYIIANNASRDYKQVYVQNAASAVKTLSNNINNSQNNIYKELIKINEGLLITISGYRELEVCFN